MKPSLRWLKRALAGFLIGIGCVLPGVSGGVMAVSFGLYRPMLDAALDFFHHPRKHFRFLLPLVIGGGLGGLLTAHGLMAAFSRYERLTLFLFMGFLLGGVPDLYREARTDGRFPPRRALWLGLGALLALPLLLLPRQEASLRMQPVQALLIGLLEGVGTVVPGVSTSFVLIRLGWYQAYLNVISSLALDRLLLIGIGFGASALACMKGVQWLFNHYPAPVYASVLGFLLLSALTVFPGFDPGSLLFADVALLVMGMVLARWMARL